MIPFAGPFEVFHNGSVDGVQNAVTPGPDSVSQAVTGTSVYRSVKTNIHNLADTSYDMAWTGTPSGTVIVQVSNKPNPDDLSDTGWKTLTLAVPFTNPAGAAGGDTIDLAGLPFHWVRLKYTNASGSGTLAAWIVGKAA